MTPQEFEYIQRAVKALEEPLSLTARIKVERTMGQILTKSADKLEQILVDKVEESLYNSNTKQRSEHA
jgi:SHS2 domain-containing protein